MRVNLYGNVANTMYMLAKYLRLKGIEARLIISREDAARESRYSPFWEDPELGDLPEWVHCVESIHLFHYWMPQGKELVHQLADCDIIQVSGLGPVWASRTGNPFVFFASGGDFNVIPLMKTGTVKQRMWTYLQRRALHRADLVLYGPWQEGAAIELRLGNGRYFPPFPIDAQKYRPTSAQTRKMIRGQIGGELILFHPTRQIHRYENPVPGVINFPKVNDRLIRAFATFLNETDIDARLVLVRVGPHVGQACYLISKLGIESQVIWLEAVEKEVLVDYYGAADIIFDQFSGIKKLGLSLVGREAMSCGRPLVTFFDLEGNREYYEDPPPLVSASTEDEIGAAIRRLAQCPEEREDLGRRAREWVFKTHHWEVAIDRYIAIYEEILTRNV